MRKRLVQLIILLIVAAGLALPSAAHSQTVVVGRVTLVEGDLLRYVPEESDWVAAIGDVPFAAGDTFYSGDQGRAELTAPNGSRARVGSATEIEYIALEPDYTEADVAGGLVRLSNRGRDTVVKVDSPFGYVLSYPGSVFDFYVGENSVEVVAVKGTVSFVHGSTNTRYDVSEGSPSILADSTQVASGEGGVDPDWDAWNRGRDRFWAEKARERGLSYQYLPPMLQSDAYVLEENGRWERVFYEGREYWFWRPTTVAYGWAPFMVGRWSEWYGDQTWIPREPFGYLTHHYGNWVLVGNQWYWAPPVVMAGLPLLEVGFAWYPGRVCWIHGDGYVGWVPLAPRETYYCRHAWGGPHAVVVTDITMGTISIGLRNYAYAGHAVVVNQNNFYGVNNYRNVRVTNISNTAIMNNYHAAPVVNNTVVSSYTANAAQKYSYTNAAVKEKPHSAVVNRIRENQRLIREAGKEKPAALSQEVKSIRPGTVNQQARVERPKMTDYMVPASDVNKPKGEMALRQRDVKTAGKGTGNVQTQGAGGQPAQAKPGIASPRGEAQGSAQAGQTPTRPEEQGRIERRPSQGSEAGQAQARPAPQPAPGGPPSKPTPLIQARPASVQAGPPQPAPQSQAKQAAQPAQAPKGGAGGAQPKGPAAPADHGQQPAQKGEKQGAKPDQKGKAHEEKEKPKGQEEGK